MNRARLNLVSIGLAYRIANRMKIVGRFARVQHADIQRQIAVERSNNLFAFDRTVGLQTANLSQRMDSGIGSSTGRDPNFFVRKDCPGFLQNLLDRQAVFLNLPTDIV